MSTTDRPSPLVGAKRRLKVRTRAKAAAKLMRSTSLSHAEQVYQRARDLKLLTKTPLFDVDWYAAAAGCEASRGAAVRHYLKKGHVLGLSPHPLFDPAYYASQLGDQATDRAVFLVYLSRARSAKASPHPLFDAPAYVKANPDARRHSHGILGHYVQEGAAAGASPNDWYVSDPEHEPGGLIDWVRARRAEWQARHDTAPCLSSSISWEDPGLLREHPGDVPAGPPGADPLVSVVMVVAEDLSLVRDMVDSVRAQTLSEWELLVVHHHGTSEVAAAIGEVGAECRIQLVAQHAPGLSRALNDGIGLARGTYLAWMCGGDVWGPEYLSRAVGTLWREGSQAAHTAMAVRSPAGKGGPKGSGGGTTTRFAADAATPERLAAGLRVDLSALVVTRSLAVEVGGFDESLPAAWDHDFVLKVAQKTPLRFIPVVGVTSDKKRRTRDAVLYRRLERPLVDHACVDSWHDVVLNRHTIDWGSLAARSTSQGTVSVVIPTHQDWRMTTRALQCVAEAAEGSHLTVETIVVDNGCGPETSVVLDSLPLRFPGVTVVHSPVNHGFALGNNLAVQHATGSVVVFLNNDTEVTAGWLEPLAAALEDREVLGAQSLLVYPTGTIQSAGVAFPSCGGVPHALLQGFPAEDAAGLETAAFSALTGAALAMRFSDVVALRGFDPLFRNGMEDVDLGLRMRRLRPGRFTVRPESVVVHHESKSHGRFTKALVNRRLLLDRWSNDMPGDDVALWRHVGYDVVRHEVRDVLGDDRRLAVPAPVLVRRPTVSVVEGSPSLRWAIKNPAPPDVSAEIWGDTHFARRLARALRGLGQQVVIDHRPEFERRTGQLDDVVLVLRGLAPYRPLYGQVNLGWLISHPEMLSRSEAESYDRLLAASVTWAERMSQQWGIRIDPLLQATDPEFFHPDRARPDTGQRVLFVGGSRKQLRPIVRDAVEQGLPLSVYGPGWEELIPSRYIKALSFPNEQLGAAYRSAGVVLNDHWEEMRVEGFISNRLFDAAAAGARVVTDDVSGLGDLFGRSVQVARDAADFVRLTSAPDLDAIFGNDEERRKVAARLHAEHSFDVRARQLLDVALEVRSSLSASRREAVEAGGRPSDGHVPLTSSYVRPAGLRSEAGRPPVAVQGGPWRR
jgi:GT2 family glycosyltransferase